MTVNLSRIYMNLPPESTGRLWFLEMMRAKTVKRHTLVSACYSLGKWATSNPATLLCVLQTNEQLSQPPSDCITTKLDFTAKETLTAAIPPLGFQLGELSNARLLQNAPHRADSELKITLCIPGVADIVKVTPWTFILHRACITTAGDTCLCGARQNWI